MEEEEEEGASEGLLQRPIPSVTRRSMKARVAGRIHLCLPALEHLSQLSAPPLLTPHPQGAAVGTLSTASMMTGVTGAMRTMNSVQSFRAGSGGWGVAL